MKLMFVECRLISPKFRRVLCERDIGRVPVDFTQIQRVFIKLLAIECVSISSKFRGSFANLIFTKSRGSFAKFSVHG